MADIYSRVIYSYSSSLELYNRRVLNGIQPSTPYFDVFNVGQQNDFLCYANAIYLAVTIALFLFMKRNASGFRLRWILVLYDGSNVAIASYIAYSILKYKWGDGGKLVCNELANNPAGYQLSWVFALFYVQKYYEFLDTWFFILRKSSRQVTFLHLFHHSSITVVVGTILPFDYNADMYLPILLNSANHMLLYLHYLLATLGIRSLWAPYITSMQLVQFCIIFLQSLVAYCLGPACGSPDFVKVLMIVYMGSMIALFVNFFLQKYVLKKPVQNLDMCGVVKLPYSIYANVPSQYCGVAVLDSRGSCRVVLPDDFPDEEWVVRETMRPAPFCVVYTLTAMRCPMPSLHVSREVSRVSDKLEQHQSSGHPAAGATSTKLSPNSATAVLTGAQSRDRKRRSSGGSKEPSSQAGGTPLMRSGARDSSTEGSPVEAVGTVGSGMERGRDKEKARRDLPLARQFARLDDSPLPGNSNVIKSASISDFRLVRSEGSLAGSRNNSSNNLQLLHNDRLIDGPLPLSESFEMINRYSQHIRAGISESIFRLTLGTLAFEGRANDAVAEDAAPMDTATAASDGIAALQDGDDSLNICGAPRAEGRSDGSDAGAPLLEGHEYPLAPLTFEVSGGVPGGRISWVVHTAPFVVDAGATGAAAAGGNSADTALAEDSALHSSAGRPVSHSIGGHSTTTGIIRSGSVNAGAGAGMVAGGGLSGHSGVSRGNSSPALNAMEERWDDHAEEYALDWRAIS